MPSLNDGTERGLYWKCWDKIACRYAASSINVFLNGKTFMLKIKTLHNLINKIKALVSMPKLNFTHLFSKM